MDDVVRAYKDIRKDYELDKTIFNDEPDKVRRVKEIVMTKLDPVDRTIILLYADCGSLRTLGKRLGISHASVKPIIDRIQERILSEYYEMVRKEMKL